MKEPLEFDLPTGPPPAWMIEGTFTGYLAPSGFLRELLEELALPETATGPEHLIYGDLVFVPQALDLDPAWVQNIWRDARLLPVPSIGQAAKELRALQRNWWAYPVRSVRRCALITDKLPKVSARAHVFGQPAPTAPLGSWTLYDETNLIAAPNCSNPFPDGQPRFEEDRLSAPSRAYLKLWETFTLTGAYPKPGELCLDLGSCPGGWTWVLASLGASVFSIDKAPIEPKIAAMPGVDHCLGSGFGLEPKIAGDSAHRVDWVLSDMACYPERLLELVRRWLEADAARNFVCTLKFQGETDHETARAFAAIPGSRLIHLAHNKHELTWVLIRD
jgi:Predicted SAM-dependent methyltransferase